MPAEDVYKRQVRMLSVAFTEIYIHILRENKEKVKGFLYKSVKRNKINIYIL